MSRVAVQIPLAVLCVCNSVQVHLAELQRLSDRARGQKCVAQVSLFGEGAILSFHTHEMDMTQCVLSHAVDNQPTA